MRREKRKKEGMDTQIIKLASIGVAILTVIVIALLIYGSKLNKEVKNGSLSREQLANLANKTSDDVGNTERTSTEMGKTVEEAKNAENNQSIENQTGNTNTSVNETKNNGANTLNNVKGTTTVVKASEAGTVKSIKNDPRYGLTIVILHDNGFETVYSNLLTSEFVVEGEKVGKGQSIGTVGNTAAFEVADDSHLHFEILKDSIQVDPSIYLK